MRVAATTDVGLLIPCLGLANEAALEFTLELFAIFKEATADSSCACAGVDVEEAVGDELLVGWRAGFGFGLGLGLALGLRAACFRAEEAESGSGDWDGLGAGSFWRSEGAGRLRFLGVLRGGSLRGVGFVSRDLRDAARIGRALILAGDGSRVERREELCHCGDEWSREKMREEVIEGYWCVWRETICVG